MQQDVLDVYQCTWLPWMQLDDLMHKLWQMHQGIYMDAQDDHWCSWMSRMSINAQVVPWCTNTFLSILMMTLIAAGCLGCLSMHKLCLDAPRDFYGCPRWPWMLKITLNAAGCLGCLSTHKFCLDAPRDLYGCSRWPSMQLDVLDVYQCTSCALLHQHIYMDAQDDPWCSWMLKMALDAAWCTWVHLDVLGCSLMYLVAA